MGLPTLLDVAAFKGVDGADAIIDECRKHAPEFTGTDAYNNGRKIPLNFDTTDQDTLESLVFINNDPLNPFRESNDGVTTSKGTYEKRIVSIKTATAYFEVDKSIIDRDSKRGSVYMEAEARRIIQNQFQALGRQFYYGGTDSGYKFGFQGLQNFCGDEFVLDAGGTGSKLASCYIVYFGDEGLTWLMGRNGSIELSEPQLCDKEKDGKTFPIFRQRMEYYPGLRMASKYCVLRIANIDVQSAYTKSPSATAFTDQLLETALMALPAGITPTVAFAPRQVWRLLRASRATVNISGMKTGSVITSGLPAPVTDFDGIFPLVSTDSLVVGENQYILPVE